MKPKTPQLFEPTPEMTGAEHCLIRQAAAIRQFREREFKAKRALEYARKKCDDELQDAMTERDLALEQIRRDMADEGMIPMPTKAVEVKP